MSITEQFKAEIAAEEAKEKPVQELIINPEFQGLLDAQTETSYTELKKLIEKDGIQNPIMVWKEENTILDGHNRHKIAGELGIPVPVQYMSFDSTSAAKEWIIRNQLGRRNLTPARFDYYIGVLYNTKVAERIEADASRTEPKTEAQGKTADKIAKQFDISPKTVRRHGVQAKGIDIIGKVKGKLEKDRQLSAKPTYTSEEVAAIASTPNQAVASRAIKKIDEVKAKAAAEKAKVKQEQAKVVGKQTLYGIALVEPSFDATGWQPSSEIKPTLDKDAIVYMIVPDEYLVQGIKLLDRWGLTYEGSFIMINPKDAYVSTFTKVTHNFVLIGTKGHILGPEDGKEPTSANSITGGVATALDKLISKMHPVATKRIDMRRGDNALNGWEKL